MKWKNYNRMTCIHGLGISVMDYVILDILVYNQIVKFDILNDHEPKSNFRTLSLTLNFILHKNSIEENYCNQRHLLFDKNKVDLSLKNLNIVMSPSN
jgi:hypothetical protein